jgi:4,5-DOPA dioxygenase extradiol
MLPPLPSLFISHGAPNLLLQGTPAFYFLSGLGATLPRPRAIVCISAHWDTARPALSAAAQPAMIYDFYGFPESLYKIQYPAPGAPELAAEIVALLQRGGLVADLDETRGLDHGAWVPLSLMYPHADIPVIQLSVQSIASPLQHWQMGAALQPLRERGVLILGSGGATHNLREFSRHALDAPPADYALQFHDWLAEVIAQGELAALLNYHNCAPHATRNHPTPEHFLPLFVPLGAAGPAARGRRLFSAFEYGVLSMAAFAWD